MAVKGHTIIMACRTLEKAQNAATQIQNDIPDQELNLIPKECNLADLSSIKSFVNGISNMSIDVACFNAGLARNTNAKDVLRTKEGFELTIGTNHLGHFYLVQCLLPLLERQKEGSENVMKRIVVTASGGTYILFLFFSWNM